jgi:hypothetical protein
LSNFYKKNGLSRPARTRDGFDVVIRVIVIGNEGHDYLKILRTIATGEKSMLSNNHALPMFSEFQFEDIIFGKFPKVGRDLSYAYNYDAKNSVGDVIEMLMQMLEVSFTFHVLPISYKLKALTFIHNLNIAHRMSTFSVDLLTKIFKLFGLHRFQDAFRDNFVIQWHPDSLRTMKVSFTRPRVYLIDFEVAIQFPPECLESERVSVGFPLGGSFTQQEHYARRHAPSLLLDLPIVLLSLMFGN